MLNSFTSTLGVITFNEFKTLFYNTLAEKTAKNPKLLVNQSREYAKALSLQTSESDRYDFKADLKIGFEKLYDIIIEITDKIKAGSLISKWISLLLKYWKKNDTNVKTMFNLLAKSYADILLKKGSRVILNPVFVFDQHLVKSCLETPQNVTSSFVAEPMPLYLHMEYFYFENNQTAPSCYKLQNTGTEFVKRFFQAINSYSSILPQKDVKKLFADFLQH
ncbi:MAG: hypothetical protein J6C85_01455 [Alphaproteobacteria bacterium]|nr:hypothetical protein [Alphaproteobacteria bacterium]